MVPFLPTPPRLTPSAGSPSFASPLRYVRHIISQCPTELLELVIGLIAILWGVVTALPVPVFATVPSYRAFQDTGIPALGWGLCAMLVGLAQLAALAFQHVQGRLITVAVTGLFLGFLTSAILVSAQAPTTGSTTYGALTLACALVYIRHRL